MRPLAALLLLAAGFLAAIAAGMLVQRPGTYGGLDHDAELVFAATTSLAGLVYALTLWRVFREPLPRHAVPLILGVGLAARLLVFMLPPINSTDIYRYVWDGRVQAAGINPYRYIPSDPALAPLRDAAPGASAIYPNINRAEYAPTIYPPAAQAIFALVGVASPGIGTMKAVMLAFDALTAGVVLLILRAAGRPAAHVAIWAWNPLVVWEFANGGHVDSPAIAFTALATLAAITRRPGWAGAALGLAVLTKLLPAALFPALWRMRDGKDRSWRTPAAAAATILAAYACYAGAGWRVLGFLPGYATEERLSDGGGYLALRLAALAGPLPPMAGRLYIAAGLVLLAAVALMILRRPLPVAAPARADVIGVCAVVLTAMLLAVLSPHYPWYLTMLVLPAVLLPRRTSSRWSFPGLSVLWPTLAGPFLYLDFALQHPSWAAIVYLPCLPLLWLDVRTWRRSLPDERGA